MRVVDDLLSNAVLNDVDVEVAAHLLTNLVAGQPLGEEHWSPRKWEEAQYLWRPVMPNVLAVGDPVRVRPDAYGEDEPELMADNGREGVVSAVRHGIVVSYTDSATGVPSMGTRHERLDALEMKVRIVREEEEVR